MTKKHSVLFLSDSEINLHLIAEKLAQKTGIDSISFISASITEKPLHSMVMDVMKQSKINLSQTPIVLLKNVDLFLFDLIITIGGSTSIQDLELPSIIPKFHWKISESKLPDRSYDVYQTVIKARNQIQSKLEALLGSEVLSAMFEVRRDLRVILDNLLDGVMAHTHNRSIFFFNNAAEKITGYNREDVLGKDCHQVFPGRFCGGDCDFCEGSSQLVRTVIKKKVQFQHPDSILKVLEMSTLPLSDETGNNIGALLSFKDETELETLRNRLRHHHSLGKMVGKDPKILDIFQQIKEISSVSASVLIQGESGTGKELVADAIHGLSERSNERFVAVNCGALPEGLLESELFGHVKGAFTGAFKDKKGRFELANGGTIFLDEVAELSPIMQVKLLRVLQDQRFEKVGSEKTTQINVRVISATNQKLKKLMKQNKFRQDLYYRLCVIPVFLPPLRERRLDIPVLLEHFLETTAKQTSRPVLTYSNEALDILLNYQWPGNVRELQNTIEYAYVKCSGHAIQIEHLPPELFASNNKKNKKSGRKRKLNKEKILDALAKSNGSRINAAKRLNVGRATLYRYLDKYHIT